MLIPHWPWQTHSFMAKPLPFKSVESTEIDFVSFKGILEHIISCTGPEHGESSWAYLSVSKALRITCTHWKNTVCLQMEQKMFTCVGKAEGTVAEPCYFSDLSVCPESLGPLSPVWVTDVGMVSRVREMTCHFSAWALGAWQVLEAKSSC